MVFSTGQMKGIQSSQACLAHTDPVDSALILGGIDRTWRKPALTNIITKRAFNPIGVRLVQLPIRTHRARALATSTSVK